MNEARAKNVEMKRTNDMMSTKLIRHQSLSDSQRKPFCFATFEGCDKDVWFYTGLSSTNVFYHVLDFVSPDRKRSNLTRVYTMQQLRVGDPLILVILNQCQQHGESPMQK